MKAAVYDRYGPADVVLVVDVEKPVPNDDEVLLEVRAASVNPADWRFVRGRPYLARLLVMGWPKPKMTRPGIDVAGRVDAVGRNVTQLKAGDTVFGTCRGSFAEYACGSEGTLVAKPDHVTFEQAAAVPLAAFTALQGLRDKGQLHSGQNLLIIGAAGGVGTYAVQIAKSFGADVTGVCSTKNVDMVRSIGADHVVDYSHEDFTEGDRRYDLILDCVGNRSLSACRRVLRPNGLYVMVGAEKPLRRLIGMRLMSSFGSQKFLLLLARKSKEDLILLRDMLEARNISSVVDRRYRLSEVAEALRYVEEGHARGKVVITMDSGEKS
jgi:NADPH:quinone reductase-like Zn-dependent oxidoreductase